MPELGAATGVGKPIAFGPDSCVEIGTCQYRRGHDVSSLSPSSVVVSFTFADSSTFTNFSSTMSEETTSRSRYSQGFAER